MEGVQQWWRDLPSTTRTTVIRNGVIVGILVVALAAYAVTDQGPSTEPVEKASPTAISLGDDLLDDDLRKQLEVDQSKQQEANQVFSEQIQAITKSLSDLKEKQASLTADDDDVAHYPPTPTPRSPAAYPPAVSYDAYAPEPEAFAVEPIQDVLIGGIGHVAGVKHAPERAKKKTGIYMPPGFMEGMLLTGLKAETVEGASENPEPMMIRVQAPAVLPNAVKANLKGCFVIAHGFGKLNKERIEARLVSLHCLNRQAEAVIDEHIKGFVVDADGSKGIAGRVVTKAGANTARVFIAGMLSGFGEGYAEANRNELVSPLGSIETPGKTSQARKRGVGRGVQTASEGLSDVFLDLVKQSSPVIEVGPAKKITLALTEGVHLSIRDLKEFDDVQRAQQTTQQTYR